MMFRKVLANLQSAAFDHRPLLSIVIANYNYGRFLDEAIRSVSSQIGSGKDQVAPGDVELIIIDGGSTDNSVEVIKKYAEGLPARVRRDEPSIVHLHLPSASITYWVSEPDKGQSDAFNKGFARARGKYLTWLNADDLLVKGCLNKILAQMRKHPDCDWFTGNYLQFREDTGKVIFAPWGPHWMPRVLQRFNAPLVVFGPTTFWSRDAYQKVGLLDESLHYSMDTDYWLRMKKAGYLQRRVNHCCWAFRMHDESKTAQYGERKIDDRVRACWYEELHIVRDKIGYRCSRWLRILGLLMRVVDGTLFCVAYRRFLVVGKDFNEYQRRMK